MDWKKFGNTVIKYRYALSLMGTACYCTFAIKPLKINYYEKHKKQLSPELKKLIDEVISEFSLDKSLLENMLFRFDNQLSASHLGVYRMPPKQIMILPEYFHFTSANEIPDDLVKSYLRRHFNVHASERKQVLNNHFFNEFKESLILSLKAKKFIIAQQFSNFNTNYFIIKTLITFFVLIISLEIMKYLSKIAPNVPFLYIGNAIFLTLLILICSYIKSYNSYQYLDSIAFALTKNKSNHSNLIFMANINNLSLIDDDYYQGALDYFENIAKRNRAVRNIALNESFFSLKRFTISDKGISNHFTSYEYNIDRLKRIKTMVQYKEEYSIFDLE